MRRLEPYLHPVEERCRFMNDFESLDAGIRKKKTFAALQRGIPRRTDAAILMCFVSGSRHRSCRQASFPRHPLRGAIIQFSGETCHFSRFNAENAHHGDKNSFKIVIFQRPVQNKHRIRKALGPHANGVIQVCNSRQDLSQTRFQACFPKQLFALPEKPEGFFITPIQALDLAEIRENEPFLFQLSVLPGLREKTVEKLSGVQQVSKLHGVSGVVLFNGAHRSGIDIGD